MADTTTAEVPIWGDELQDWMNIGDSTTPNWVNVTNLLSWEFSDDANTYEPEYIDRGYEHLEDKLCSLGAEIRREKFE